MNALSPKEQAVADLLPEGLQNSEIARRLNMREATVKVHMKMIHAKLGLKNRTQVAIYVDRQRAGR